MPALHWAGILILFMKKFILIGWKCDESKADYSARLLVQSAL